MAEKSPARQTRARSENDPFRAYEEQFIASPDPWAEIVKLDHGSDRTFGSTVRAMVMNAEPAQRPAMEKKLIQALAAPGLTAVGQMFVCRMLALIGTAECVPAVAPLLNDKATADAARFALDGIENPAIDAAYRGALGKLSGDAKAGLIGSIARRGDRAALAAIQAIQADTKESAIVRTAAARAVERLTSKS
jgi:hypothetical protein